MPSIFLPERYREYIQPTQNMRRWLRLTQFGLICFLLVAIAIFCVTWYFQATIAREATARAMADVNAALRTSGSSLTYRDIQVSGFPFSVTVHLSEPHATLHMKALLPPAERTTVLTPEWIEEAAFSGEVTLSVNLFSDRYRLAVSGPVTHTSTINGVRSTFISQINAPVGCTLGIEAESALPGNMWNITRLASTPQDQLESDFRSLSCSTQAYALLEESQQEQIITGGPASINVSTLPDAGSLYKHALEIAFQDYEFRPRADALLEQYSQLLGNPPRAAGSIGFAAYGKQNADIQVSLRGPKDIMAFSDGVSFAVSVPKLTVTNALYNVDARLFLASVRTPESRTIRLRGGADTSFNRQFERVLARWTLAGINLARHSDHPALEGVRQTLNGMSNEQALAMVAPAIPQLHTFGATSFRVEGDITGDPVLHRGNLALTRMEMNSTPYGLGIQGNVALPGDGKALDPASSLMAICRNCGMLTDDISRYTQRFHQALSRFDPTLAAAFPRITPALAEGVKAFATAVGDKRQDPATGADALLFALTVDADGKPVLNGRSPYEVNQIYAGTIAAALPRAEIPPAPAPAEASPSAGGPADY